MTNRALSAILSMLIAQTSIAQPWALNVPAPVSLGKKSEGYKPFVITSQKLGTHMPDTYIMENLMCRSTREKIAEFMVLLQDYDLLATDAADGSVSFTYFAGRQEGREVPVMLAVDSTTHVLSFVWVDGIPNLQCF